MRGHAKNKSAQVSPPQSLDAEYSAADVKEFAVV
jgi:hypothetical protein